MSEDEISTCPLTGWAINTVDEYETVIFQPHYITAPTDNLEADSFKDKNYIMTLEQTRQLTEALSRAITRLEQNAKAKPKHEIN